MTKTKLRIAAALLAVLLLACAWIGAVSAADTATFARGTVQNIYLKGTNYWTTTDQAPVIPVTVTTSDGTYKYLTAYDVDITGSLTEQSLTYTTGYTLENVVASWDANAKAVNGWKIASTASGTATSLIDISTPQQIFSINILANQLTVGNTYAVTIPAGTVIGVAKEDTPSEITAVDFLSEDDSLTEARIISFYVRAKPVITNFDVADYVTGVDDAETVYLYQEHGNVIATANDNPYFNADYDNIQWTPSGNDNFFTLADVEGHPMQNTITIGSGLTGDALPSITVTLNEGTPAESEKSFNVNLSKWNPGFVDNKDTSSGQNGKEAEKWNFENPRKVEYTVRAGEVDISGDGWNSGVTFANLQGGGDDPAPVQWNPTLTYTIPDSKTFMVNGKYAGETLQSDQVFKVTTNNVNDGSKVVTLTFTGKKMGDADMDDGIDITDSAIVGIDVLQGEAANTLLTHGTEAYLYADCNQAGGDGAITVADILAINKYLVDLPPWPTTT